MTRALSDLTAGLLGLTDGAGPIDTGVVTAIPNTAPTRVTVKVNGTTTDVRRFTSYAPVVGDVVVLARLGSTVFALGSLAT